MKKAFWKKHIDACNSSNLSKMAYASQQSLVYSQFVYWSKKLSVEPKNFKAPAQSTSEAPFAAVKVKSTQAATDPKLLGVLEFPGGAKLLIHDAQLLAELPGLCWGHS